MPSGFLERLLISVLFALAGLAKLLGLEAEVDAFARWGFPAGFMYFIGILEVAGAIGLWASRLTAFVALCLAVLAVGALGTRLVFGEWAMALVTAVLLAITLHYIWRHRDDLLPGENASGFSEDDRDGGRSSH